MSDLVKHLKFGLDVYDLPVIFNCPQSAETLGMGWALAKAKMVDKNTSAETVIYNASSPATPANHTVAWNEGTLRLYFTNHNLGLLQRYDVAVTPSANQYKYSSVQKNPVTYDDGYGNTLYNSEGLLTRGSIVSMQPQDIYYNNYELSINGNPITPAMMGQIQAHHCVSSADEYDVDATAEKCYVHVDINVKTNDVIKIVGDNDNVLKFNVVYIGSQGAGIEYSPVPVYDFNNI